MEAKAADGRVGVNSGFLVVTRMCPLLPTGKYFDTSISRSSALSMTKIQGFDCVESQWMPAAKFAPLPTCRASEAKPDSAFSSLLASIQNTPQ